MKVTVEQKLVGSRPEKSGGNRAFIARTMDAVRAAGGSETFERALRTTNATKWERLTMRLKHLPKAAVIGLVSAGVLAVSGTAFAAYQLWISPTVEVWRVQHSVAGDKALLKLQHCQQVGNTAMVTINPHSNLTPSDAAAIIAAQCEVEAVQQWAMAALHVSPSDIAFPYVIQAISDSSIRIANGTDVRTVSLDGGTVYVAKGSYISKEQLKIGDVVAYVSTQNNGPALAFVKLSESAKYFDSKLALDVVVSQACGGNPQDLCSGDVATSSLPIHPWGEPGANPKATGDWKEIQGKLVSHDGSIFTLRASSGDFYTVTGSEDFIGEYNATYAPDWKKYNTNGADLSIAIGDTLFVDYRQGAGADGHRVAANELDSINLVVTGDAKAGTLQKY